LKDAQASLPALSTLWTCGVPSVVIDAAVAGLTLPSKASALAVQTVIGSDTVCATLS